MTWDWAYAWDVLPRIAEGLFVTVEATVIGTFLAMLLGLVWAIARHSGPKLVSVLVGGFVEFIRSTPLLVQLYVLFFALPSLGITLGALVAGIIGLGLHYSTYVSEVYRAGINSVPTGQWEAASVLSLSSARTWTSVILPQAIRPMIPALGNYFIAMFKDTPLLAAITVVEILNRAQMIGSETFRFAEPLTIVGVLFLLISYPSALFVRWLERRFAVS